MHEGAIYLHLGRSYEVRDLDLDHRRALVAPFDGDWYTQPKRETTTAIERLLDRRDALGVTLSLRRGVASPRRCSPTSAGAWQTTRRSTSSRSTCRETSFSTQALWFELDPGPLTPGGLAEEPRRKEPQGPHHDPANGDPAGAAIPLESLLGALHATEHAQIAVLPLIAMCDRWDIGGLSTNLHPQTGRPTIFIYDGHPGGIGITRTAFARFEELCEDALRLIAELRLRGRLPLVRAVAEVRQPQRTAVQGGRPAAAGANARTRTGRPRRRRSGNGAALIAPERC